MDGKTITIKIETVSGSNAGAKKVVSDLEKEVLESQRRVQANSKATDRAILQSQTASTNAAKQNIKTQANEFIRNMKQMESEAKRSSTSIRASIEDSFKGAFGGGLIGGAVGGFAGSIVASFTQQVAQLPSILKTQLDEAVKIAAERQNALKGLESIAIFRGISAKETQDAVKNLRLVRAGILDITEASTTLKNLLSSNFSLNESIKIIEAFSDTAAFGKSAALGFGEAIRSASEGIRNGNSILVDNVGLTKNLSQILKEAGFEEKDLSRVKDDLNVRQALFNGLIKEALPQLGDADKLTQGWTGSTSALTTAQNNLYAAVGNVIINNKDLIALTQTLTGEVNTLTGEVSKSGSVWNKTINSMTSMFSEFVLKTGIGIDKEIADLKELGNTIELVGNAMGFAITVGAGDPLGYYPKLKKNWEAVGSFSSGAEANARRLTEEYNRRRFADVQTNRSLFPFAPQAPLGSQRRQFANPYDPNSPLYFGPKPANPTTFAGGGSEPSGGNRSGGRGRVRAAANTDDRRVRELKAFADEMGFTVTSGFRTKGTTGAHAAGIAVDIRTTGKSTDEIGQFVASAIEKGFRIVDERVKIANSPFWSGPHLHMEANNRRESQLNSNLSYGGIPVGFLRELDAKRFTKNNVTKDEIDKYLEKTALKTEGAGITDDIDLRQREKLIKLGEDQIDVYKQLQEAMFNVNEHTKEEVFWFDYKLGKYPQLNAEQAKEIANYWSLVDAAEARKKVNAEVEEIVKKRHEDELDQMKELQDQQKRMFEETRQGWEDLLNDLATGNFKSIWDRMRRQMLDAFIKPASTYLAQLFGGGMGGMQPAMAGGGFGGGAGNIFGSIFGGGTNNRSMGPGGTPYFNPVSQFAGGGGQGFGGGGGIISQLFGAFGGGGRGAAPEPAAAAAGMPWLKTLGGSSPIGGAGGGFGGMLRGMGGGSMMAGIGSGLGQLGMIAGSAVGGKWGNLLSLTGMGASIGASFGPWGAAIGAGIGAGAGLISMLFMRDNSLKKLKEAAASEFGISVKDKDILKQLKAIGEQYFGKGQAGKNAQATVRTEEGMNILRAYAESTGQSGLKIDRLNYGDENWSGNQFKSRFGGFRAMGGPVMAGMSYIVGERRPEVFTPSVNGTISPTVGGFDPKTMAMIADAIYELKDEIGRIKSISAGKMLQMGVNENPEAVGQGYRDSLSRDPRGAESTFRYQGQI